MARIKTLILKNFQGVASQGIDFACVNTTIYGKNGTGKSTVANAIAWLLYDKPNDGAKNYTPKTHGANGHLHNLDHVAEMEIEMDNGLEYGTILRLKRVYHEIYHKKRGSNIEEFDGHVTDHYIDGVPMTEKEYKARVAEICPTDMAKVLTQPWYFAEGMARDERRRTLLSVCGDISDEDVIDATPEIADLPDVLRKPGASDAMYSVDEYRRIAAARKADINRDLQSIPSRIDEANRAIPEVAASADNIDADMTAKRKQIEMENEKLRGIKTPKSNGEAEANIRARIADWDARLSEGRAAYKEQIANETDAYRKRKMEKQEKLNAAENERARLNREWEEKRRELETVNSRRTALLSEYNTVSGQAWDKTKEICPTCKRPLEAGDVEAMRQEFNLAKSEKLAKLKAEGQAVGKDVIAAKENAIKDIENIITDVNAKITTLHGEIEKIEAEMPKHMAYEDSEEYCTFNIQREKVRQELAEINTGVSSDVSAAVAAQEAVIKSLAAELERIQQVKANTEQATKLRERVKELEALEKELARNYEQTERGLCLCELFVRAKVSMLTEAINAKFTKVKFRLFKEQINGGLADDCEVMVPAHGGAFVPWAEGANTGAKINAGLEIIKVLSNHWAVSLPVVVDNAECVSEWADIGAQLIRLVVTTTDDTLRVEHE